jgi:hypothetical protein
MSTMSFYHGHRILCVSSSGAMEIHALAGVQVNAGPTP